MGGVFFSVGMSLDGCIAPEGTDPNHADEPNYKDWLRQWMELQKWTFQQRLFHENLKLGEDGETGQDNRMGQDAEAGFLYGGGRSRPLRAEEWIGSTRHGYHDDEGRATDARTAGRGQPWKR
jgi:hypothetical protein